MYFFQMTQHRVCDQCPNLRSVVVTEEVELEIEPGMMDGMTQRFSGMPLIQPFVLQIRNLLP